MTDETPKSPAPGSPDFRAMIEAHKDYIEATTGIRAEFILDIGVGDQMFSPKARREREKRGESSR